MKITTVVGYANQDSELPFVSEADEAVCLDGEESLDTYLNIKKIIEVCKKKHVTHLHPGYGFLSENPAFVEACDNAGIEFVGPTAKAMRLLGDKIGSRRFLADLEVPLLPSYEGDDQSLETLTREARRVGFPVLIKPSAGGGGKGMYKVDREEDFSEALASSQRVAKSAFNDDRVFLEKWVEPARHIEVQVLADKKGNVHIFGERECSLQRRHQKVMEETPCLDITGPLRKRIYEASRKLVKAAGYYSAGTVEWVWDGKDGIYFLEVNARLQVEHPVTEMVWNVDLVELQLRVARGEPIESLEMNSIGHAIEVRICAEDPMRDFMPSGGKIHRLRLPANARVDFGFKEKNTIPAQFDSMIGKIIVIGKDRAEALQKMRETLKDLTIFGPTTNRTYLIQILDDEHVRRGEIYTTLLSKMPPRFNELEAIRLIRNLKSPVQSPEEDLDFYSPWGGVQQTTEALVIEDFGERRYYHTHFADWSGARPRKKQSSGASAEIDQSESSILSPMPAKVVRVMVNRGDRVKKGDLLIVVEAMKMEHQMKATRDAKIKTIAAKVGDRVMQDQMLIEFEGEEKANA